MVDSKLHPVADSCQVLVGHAQSTCTVSYQCNKNTSKLEMKQDITGTPSPPDGAGSVAPQKKLI